MSDYLRRWQPLAIVVTERFTAFREREAYLAIDRAVSEAVAAALAPLGGKP